jgi:hypothetical protein
MRQGKTLVFLAPICAVLFVGCGPKLHNYVNNIDNLSIHAERSGIYPVVDFGEFESDVNDDGVITGMEYIAEGQNLAVDAATDAFASRLDSQVQQRELAADVASNARQAMGEGNPFPLSPQSSWNMAVSIVEWGVSPGFNGSADAFMNIFAELIGPTGDQAWRDSVSCRRDLAPDTFTAASQISANVAAMMALGDQAIIHTFNQLAQECGRELTEEFRGDVIRARAKAE